MRVKLWAFDTVTVDLEDRDVSVKLIHKVTLSEIMVCFRVPENLLEASALDLRRHIENLATDKILDLASYLDHL